MLNSFKEKYEVLDDIFNEINVKVIKKQISAI
jgi:hypothetical protein